MTGRRSAESLPQKPPSPLNWGLAEIVLPKYVKKSSTVFDPRVFYRCDNLELLSTLPNGS
jgi:hypothetical protein